MAYKIPYTFVPGTKAKANEMNSNFSKVTEYLTDLNDNLTTTQNNLDEIQSDLDQTQEIFKTNYTKLCVNSSNGTLITNADNVIYFNSIFTITNSNGESATISTLPSINCGSFANGTYNIFVSLDSTREYFANKIYRQLAEPTVKSINDIWINTSSEPINAKIWDGSQWNIYSNIPIGSITVANNTVTAVTIFPYNQNGYNINSNSSQVDGNLSVLTTEGKSIISKYSTINYSSKTTLSWNTLYQAETDGFIFAHGQLQGNKQMTVLGGTTSSLGSTLAFAYQAEENGVIPVTIPIPKNHYFKITGTGLDYGSYFYKTKGGN